MDIKWVFFATAQPYADTALINSLIQLNSREMQINSRQYSHGFNLWNKSVNCSAVQYIAEIIGMAGQLIVSNTPSVGLLRDADRLVNELLTDC